MRLEVLIHIYYARKEHKLEEWHTFCRWVEELPYAKDLILIQDVQVLSQLLLYFLCHKMDISFVSSSLKIHLTVTYSLPLILIQDEEEI